MRLICLIYRYRDGLDKRHLLEKYIMRFPYFVVVWSMEHK